MTRRIQRGAEGFTLVELLVVILVLGILAAIVVFAVGTTGKTAAAAACQADVKTVEVALETSRAQSHAYDAPIANLVADGYLKEPPSNSHYSIDVNSNGGVLVTPPGGSTTTFGPAGVNTPAAACTGVG